MAGSQPKNDAALLADAKEHFKQCMDAWAENRRLALEDMKFRALDQWPQKLRKAREDANRPCLTVDKLNQYIRQVVNDGRQNRPSIKVLPVDDGADVQVGETFQGVIRSIWNASDGDDACDTALDHAASSGFGFIRVLTDYAYERSFYQDICIKRVRNPLSCVLDPNIKTADGSDAAFGFFIDELSKEEFEQAYPQAKATDWEMDAPKYSDGWMNGDNVRVCEYFYTVEEPETLHQLADGTVVSEDEYQKALKEVGQGVPPIQETREITARKVKWCRLTGAEILEKRDWLGKYIPIIPVFGNEFEVDGKVIYSGLVRAAKDAQMLHNYMRSAYAERVALTPKAPWLVADGQIEDYQEQWANANTGETVYLPYKPMDVGGTPVPPPQRISPSDTPAGFAQDMQLSEHDIQAALGMYAASVGQPSNEKSGKAIMARQREGDTATFHYQDNLNRAIRHLGRILVDLIPKVYDTRRVVRVLGEDGSVESVMHDPDQDMARMEMGAKAIFNLGVGTYDVSVAAGPSYTTKRQEALEAGMQLAQSVPQLWQLVGDIIIKNADWPGADEIAKRMKLMLPPQIQQAEQGEAQLPPEIQQAMQQIQQGQEQLTQAHQQLQAMAQQVAEDKAATDAERAKLDAARQQLQSEQKVLQSKYEELSAKLELQAAKLFTPVPPEMPPGKEEPAIDPNQPPQGGFFTPEGAQ